MNGDQRFRVFNRCKYDVGVKLINGQAPNIKAGSFLPLTVNDILFIESICGEKKFFSSKMLVPVDDSGRELTLEELGGYPDPNTKRHLSDEEITAALKKPAKAIEAWLNEIEDPEELHAIFEVAKTLDLPSSKLKVLRSKMPHKEWLGEE